eukprot:4369970-Alexandrium_andersonii.AAC.1
MSCAPKTSHSGHVHQGHAGRPRPGDAVLVRLPVVRLWVAVGCGGCVLQCSVGSRVGDPQNPNNRNLNRNGTLAAALAA